MRPIYFVQEGPHMSRFEHLVRCDLAWGLFLPQSPGDVPTGDSRQCLSLARWFWDTMGQMGGRLRPESSEPIICVVPPLTIVAREFVIRLASFWADQVLWLTPKESVEGGFEMSDNLWVAPVYDVMNSPKSDSIKSHFRELYEESEQALSYMMPALGVGRAFMRVEVVPPGHATARLHSHSAVDEYYLILSGRGTLRMGIHDRVVGPHQMIGKPTGPDLTSHLVADQGEVLTVLDIEIWPDASLRTKDVVSYPDFNEILYRGPGWGAIATEDSLRPPGDFLAHYDDGYRRHGDGSWEAREIPGTVTRRSK